MTDLRSAISVIVACKVMMSLREYHLIYNSDATQYCVGAMYGNKKASYVGDANADDDVAVSLHTIDT